MKKLNLLLSLSLAALLAGCQSTPSSSSNSEEGDDIKPAFSMTVAANSLKEWPITGEIKFAYKNGSSNTATDKSGNWNRYVNEATVMKFQALGMTFVNESEADYLITSTLASGDDPNAAALFGNLDPGVNTKQKGTLKIEVYDLLTKKTVWEGIIQAYSDYPVVSAQNKKYAATMLVNQVTQRLPMVDR